MCNINRSSVQPVSEFSKRDVSQAMTRTDNKSMRSGFKLVALNVAIWLAFVLQMLSPHDHGAAIVQSLFEGQMPIFGHRVPCDLVCKGPQILPATGDLNAHAPRLRDI